MKKLPRKTKYLGAYISHLTFLKTCYYLLQRVSKEIDSNFIFDDIVSPINKLIVRLKVFTIK